MILLWLLIHHLYHISKWYHKYFCLRKRGKKEKVSERKAKGGLVPEESNVQSTIILAWDQCQCQCQCQCQITNKMQGLRILQLMSICPLCLIFSLNPNPIPAGLAPQNSFLWAMICIDLRLIYFLLFSYHTCRLFQPTIFHSSHVRREARGAKSSLYLLE